MLILSMDDVANTEVIVEHPQVEPQEIPQPEIVPTPPEKKSKLNLWLSIVSVLLLTFILGTYYFIIQSKPKTSQPEEILVTEEVEQEDFTNYSFDVGFQISLPKKWHYRFVEDNNNHLLTYLINNKLTQYPQIEIEAVNSSTLYKDAWQNPLYIYESDESKTVNSLTVEIKSGQEKYQTSNKKVRTAFINEGDKHLKITLLTSKDDPESLGTFDQIINSIELKGQSSSGLLKTVYAEENTVIPPSSIPNLNYKEVKIMGPLIESEISKEDPQVDDGYAEGYKFYALKSQRLTTVAGEDRASNPNSFIKSAVYDESGNLMTGWEKDTRVEFEAPTSGYYFLVVRSFGNQEGKYKLGIFDRDQTENKVFIKYKNGDERFLDYNKDLRMGEEEVSLVFEFTSPVEILPDNVVQYEGASREFEPSPGLIASPIEVYSMQGTYEELKASSVVLPEDSSGNKQDITLTKLGPSRILISPTNGLFGKNLHIYIKEQSIGGYRFFTEGESPVVTTPPTQTPIPENIPVTNIVEATGIVNAMGKEFSFNASFPENGGEFSVTGPGYCDYINDGHFEKGDSTVAGTVSAICNYHGISFSVDGDYLGNIYLDKGEGSGSWEANSSENGSWSIRFPTVN